MSKLNDYVFRLEDYNSAYTVLIRLLENCGVDAVLKGIQEYCIMHNEETENKIFIIDEPYSLLFKDGSLIISKPIK